MRQEIERLTAQPQHFRLFLEYWAPGVRGPAIRRRVGVALDRYRAAFESVAHEMFRAERARKTDVTPELASHRLRPTAMRTRRADRDVTR